MEKEEDGFKVPIPEGVLPDVQILLKQLILDDPKKAWEYLIKDPIAVVALSKIRKELINSSSENYKIFIEQYDHKVKSLFNIDQSLEHNGLALTVDFLIESWKHMNQSINFSSLASILIQNLETINMKVNGLDPSVSTTVLQEMVRDGLKRMIDMENYEKDKAEISTRRLMEKITPIVKKDIFNDQDINVESLHDWLRLATMKDIYAQSFRQQLSNLLYDLIKTNFEKLTEEKKFDIAPWVRYLEKIKQT